MRIVQVIPFYDPATSFGGPVRTLKALCPALARRGHDVLIVTTDVGVGQDVPRDAWVQRDGCRVWYASVSRLLGRPPYYVAGTRRPLAEAALGADVVHAQSGLNMLNDFARRAAQRVGAALVYTPRGGLCPVRMRYKALTKRLFLHLVERRVLRAATLAQALTGHEVDDLVRNGVARGRIRIVPNGFDPAPVRDADAAREFRRRFGIPADASMVLFMGRVHRLKGLDLLIEAFARSTSNGRKAVLVIAGADCGYRGAAERLSDRLGLNGGAIFTGHLDGDMKSASLSAADVFALTSCSEGLSNAVLEAAAYGCPLLVSEPCHMPEVAELGAGRVCALDVKCISAALTELLAEPKLRVEMGARAKQMVEERYKLPNVVDAIERMYDEAVDLNTAAKAPADALSAGI